MRVVGIVAPFDSRGSVPGKNSFYRGPGDKSAQVPQAAVRHGRVRQSSGTGQCGDCIRVLWVSGLWDQYSGKLRFIGIPGGEKTRRSPRG